MSLRPDMSVHRKSSKRCTQSWTYHDNPPRRGHVRRRCRHKQAKLIPLSFADKFLAYLPQLLHNQQARQALHDDEPGAGPPQQAAPPRRGAEQEWVHALGEDVEADEQEERVHGHLHEGEGRRAP